MRIHQHHAPFAFLLILSFATLECSGFATPRSSALRSVKCNVLAAKNPDNDNSDVINSFLNSLPDPDAIKDNITGGKVGERGEAYVIAQFSLLLFIAIGDVPFIGDAITTFLGPSMILLGLFIVYKSASDLKNNLSPYPVPSEKGALIDSGIYGLMRHPMYSGVLIGMAGLSLVTDSVLRMLLTVVLYFVLDVKSDYEETLLVESYGKEYQDYKVKVANKFFPAELKDVLTS